MPTNHHLGNLHLDRRANQLLAMSEGNYDDLLLTTAQLAGWLAISVEWIEINRHRNPHLLPAYVRIGHRVRYRLSDVRTWLCERTQHFAARKKMVRRAPVPDTGREKEKAGA